MHVDESQPDHFLCFITSPQVVQNLPFGQRYLFLTNANILEIPNVIRSMIPQRITEQYRQFCSETNFTLFRTSTMLRILSSCTTTVRKSLQGLDYFAAEGAKAFDEVTALVEKLGDRHWVLKCQQLLKEGKQYLKTDYKVSTTKLEFAVSYTNITQQDQLHCPGCEPCCVFHTDTKVSWSTNVTSYLYFFPAMAHYLFSTE